MINTIEYKLHGNDFKLLQFLKTIDRPISNREISSELNISDRTIRSCVKVLREHNIIKTTRVNLTYQYFVNDFSLWNMKEETSRDIKNYVRKVTAWEKEQAMLEKENNHVELH